MFGCVPISWFGELIESPPERSAARALRRRGPPDRISSRESTGRAYPAPLTSERLQ
jgi:hypothetical protein